MNDCTVHGDSIIVTGAASGIGNAVVLQAVKNHWHVVACDIQDPPVGHESPESVHWIQGDVRDQATTTALLEEADIESLKGIVLCAGVGPTEKDTKLIVETNLLASVRLVKAAIRVLKPGSLIMMVGSPAARRCEPTDQLRNILRSLIYGEDDISSADLPFSQPRAAYEASKWGVERAAVMLSDEAIWNGIRVICVIPGPTMTAMAQSMKADNPVMWKDIVSALPLRRLPSPDGIAETMLLLFSPQFAELHGSTLNLDFTITANKATLDG